MKIKKQKIVWDAQIKENGKWGSIYRPVNDISVAESILEDRIKALDDASKECRILPISVDSSK